MKPFGFHVIGLFVTVCTLFVSQLTRAELDEKQSSPVVQINSGAVVGKIENLPHGKSVYEYLGIPYAEPPVGELRFAAPKPAKPWSGIKDAKEFGPECPQLDMPVQGWNMTVENSEDCLTLNVFVPTTIKPDEKIAVMVWIHGGGFSFGSGWAFPGGVLAAFNDVIVVSINYRLGVLGFLNVPGTDVTGNFGMLDQVLALKWIQANIVSFGGDSKRVTIFAQSAGAIAVSLHLISPLSKGLFHRAIIQSGASSSPIYSGKVTSTTQLKWFAKAINCSMGPSLLECVRGKAVEGILTAQTDITFPKYTGTADIVGPIVDGEFLPDLPEILFKTRQFHADVDVITGFTSNEGSMFVLMLELDSIKDGIEKETFQSFIKEGFHYARKRSPILDDLILFQYTNHADPDDKIAIRQSLMDCSSHSLFAAPTLLEAKALAKGGRPPYVYVFDHRAEFLTLPDWVNGVAHGLEIPFVFGSPFKKIPAEPYINALIPKYSETEKGMSLYVMKLWTDFAKYGSPNPPDSGTGPVTWPRFTEQDQAYLVLSLKPRVKRSYEADKIAFWNEIVPKIFEFAGKEKKETDGEKAPKDEL